MSSKDKNNCCYLPELTKHLGLYFFNLLKGVSLPAEHPNLIESLHIFLTKGLPLNHKSLIEILSENKKK